MAKVKQAASTEKPAQRKRGSTSDDVRLSQSYLQRAQELLGDPLHGVRLGMKDRQPAQDTDKPPKGEH